MSARLCAPLVCLKGSRAPLPKWLAPDDPRTPRALADEISNFYFQGIAAA